MKSKVVNFFGGPGSGKSTCAAALFANLRFLGNETDFSVPGLFDKDVINIIEWNMNNAGAIQFMLDETDSLNVFLLRTTANEAKDTKALSVDSEVLNLLNSLKTTIHVLPYGRETTESILNIMRTKGWLNVKAENSTTKNT